MTNSVVLLVLLLTVLAKAATGNEHSSSDEATGKSRCHAKADVILMVPRAPNNGTVEDFQEFAPLENFLIKLVNYLEIDDSLYNVGLLMYGRMPVVMTHLRPYKERKLVNTGISLMANTKRYQKEFTGTANVTRALETMIEMFTITEQQRPNFDPMYTIPKIGILILPNGSFENSTESVNMTAFLRDKDITLYVVLTDISSADFAFTVATDACKVYQVDDMNSDLDRILPLLGNSLCGVPHKDSSSDQIGNCPTTLLYDPPSLQKNIFCDEIYNNELRADADNCAYFYRCNGASSERLRCYAGDVFDAATQTCNHRESVSCYSQITCPEPTGLFPYPGECRRFLNCYEGMPYVQGCPLGLIFDKYKKRCLHPTETSCVF